MKEIAVWLVGDLNETNQWEIMENIEVFSSEEEAKEYAKNNKYYDSWREEEIELYITKKTFYIKQQ